jgi:hypothetical protein
VQRGVVGKTIERKMFKPLFGIGPSESPQKMKEFLENIKMSCYFDSLMAYRVMNYNLLGQAIKGNREELMRATGMTLVEWKKLQHDYFAKEEWCQPEEEEKDE